VIRHAVSTACREPAIAFLMFSKRDREKGTTVLIKYSRIIEQLSPFRPTTIRVKYHLKTTEDKMADVKETFSNYISLIAQLSRVLSAVSRLRTN
jgi:hypothetical protein